jgi:4-hydroxy-4-methyl-2-oxoglutarate aldolase
MPLLPPETFEAICQFDTCTVANAIEQLGLRLRNEGFTKPGLRCATGGFPRVLGYAATSKLRSADPPMTGKAYRDRTDWWPEIGGLAAPRIAVIQDLEPNSGGAVVGEVHASILKAFECRGVITNGSVRDIPAVMRMNFPMFSAFVSVSHSYAHLVEFGTPVEIFGLRVESGDLLYADCHGVISIPTEIAADIPAVAREIRAREQRIVAVCQSADFSPEKLLEVIE